MYMIKNIISKSTAGGGKTTELINRINQLKKNGISNDKILIISFTNSTCEDIFGRSGVVAQTVHSFCYKFLSNNYDIMENTKDLVKIFLHKYFYLENLGIGQVSRLIDSYSIFQNYSEHIDFLDQKDIILNQELQSLILDINEEKRNHSIMFFSDIIHKFKKSIDEFLFKIGSQYDHLLLDEAQDLSYLQLEIIFKIIEEIFIDQQKTIYIVGDPKQSIYSFQGANIEYYKSFINKVIDLYKFNNLEIYLEEKNKTYRFGGEILKLINQNFEQHTSNKKDGIVFDFTINKYELLDYVECCINLLEKYNNEDIMILFSKNSVLINELQNHLSNKGMKIKVWLHNLPIIEGLRDIFAYTMTRNLWYKAKILQSPFYYMQEPEFYFIAKNNLENYDQQWFNILIKKSTNASELLEFLTQKFIHIKEVDMNILQELYYISKSYVSLGHFILNLPDTLMVESPGLKFSTIHSAKGLESKVVIFIHLPKTKEHITVNLQPFFFFKYTDNDQTRNILQQNVNIQLQEKQNIDYVALTRAQEILINLYLK